ncbi:MAG: hypothetical protein KC877_01230 [Candidatus Kaiserbacteria bacterium]|nr:hypothetical protein [Candidatus Kaiserbacteria bacterium]MCB9816527.1 hypothetical protein [Candidatus Nomurabacteria bacterium]
MPLYIINPDRKQSLSRAVTKHLTSFIEGAAPDAMSKKIDVRVDRDLLRRSGDKVEVKPDPTAGSGVRVYVPIPSLRRGEVATCGVYPPEGISLIEWHERLSAHAADLATDRPTTEPSPSPERGDNDVTEITEGQKIASALQRLNTNLVADKPKAAPQVIIAAYEAKGQELTIAGGQFKLKKFIEDGLVVYSGKKVGRVKLHKLTKKGVKLVELELNHNITVHTADERKDAVTDTPAYPDLDDMTPTELQAELATVVGSITELAQALHTGSKNDREVVNQLDGEIAQLEKQLGDLRARRAKAEEKINDAARSAREQMVDQQARQNAIITRITSTKK